MLETCETHTFIRATLVTNRMLETYDTYRFKWVTRVTNTMWRLLEVMAILSIGKFKYWQILFYPYNWVSEKNGKTNLAKGSMALTLSSLDLKFSWQIIFLLTCFCYISSLHVHKVVCPSFL